MTYEPKTSAGKRLLEVMSTVPPDGRRGLAWFVEAIEVEARNLGYADRLEEHIDGLCDDTTTIIRRAGDVLGVFRSFPASLAAVHVEALDALQQAINRGTR